MSNNNTFPANFTWGVATAAYQLEGAVNEDGRGTSIWDTFSHLPGRVTNDHTADVSTDHYHLWKEDIQRMKWLGVKAYRFSLAWPRILPNGTGAINSKGIDFYNKLIDELLKNDITPWVTLYHWDLPQTLQDRFGGWESRDCARAFEEYASVAAKSFSDRVTNWFTTNEFGNVVNAGYQNGSKAPGLTLSNDRVIKARHNALLGHGMALNAVRQFSTQPCKIGFAEDLHAVIPLTDSPQDIAAACKVMKTHFYASAMLEGAYSNDLASFEKDLPAGWEKDMPIIGSKVDFVGINCYSVRGYAAHDDTQPNGVRFIPPCKSHPAIGVDWLVWDPDVLYWSTRLVKQTWNVDNIVISENGACSSTDALNRAGEVNDTDRLMLLRSNLRGAQRAIAEGVPLTAYFQWSLLDNYEWSDGFAKRFGLFYVNYQTLERTPKLSAYYYREVATQNRVVG